VTCGDALVRAPVIPVAATLPWLTTRPSSRNVSPGSTAASPSEVLSTEVRSSANPPSLSMVLLAVFQCVVR
jgi:hypothetical protein